MLLTDDSRLSYWTVLGPGRSTLGNFWSEEDAHTFQQRVVDARLDQLERIKSTLSEGEYRGELNFRQNGITIEQVIVPMMTEANIEEISSEQLVDGSFLVASGSCRRA